MGIISHFPGGAAQETLPEFSYTGTYSLIDDEDGDWRIKFLTSGTLTFTDKARTLDVFLVGAGGGGNAQYSGGGGGGYTSTQLSVTVSKDTGYAIVIGAGVSDGIGGTTSGFSFSAAGGKYGGYGGDYRTGGAGGSGGGGYSTGSGGEDGSSGGSSTYAGGAGQGTTTREFAESAGDLYAGGGGAYGGAGGAGGGGNGGTNGTPNTGGGAGGGDSRTGGSGIVVIRNHRAA